MSLSKKRRMTEKNLAAHRRNAKLSKGPATPEGRERMRNANLRHGFYSKSDEAALRALGEDPAEFRKLREGLREKRTAADTLEDQIADRLARGFLRWNRADRMLEGCSLRQAREEDSKREGRLHVQMMRLKMTARNWQWLAQSVAYKHYVTPAADLELMKQLHKEGVAKEMSEVALALFYQLREPGTLGPGDPGFVDDESMAQQRMVLFRIKQIFGITDEEQPEANAGATEEDVAPAEAGEGDSSPDIAGIPNPVSQDPYPHITEAQWQAREPVRQLLENLLTRQVQIFEAQHHDLMRQCLSGPSPHERAAEIAPTLASAQFMQRMEDSNFRQILRLSHLLLRMRREQRLGGAQENASEFGKVKENKGG